MKKYIILAGIALFAFAGHINAQTNYSMVIEKTDGSKVTIPTTSIKEVNFLETTNTGGTGYQGPQRFFGNSRVKAFGREGIFRYDFTYDEKTGYITKIHAIEYSDDIDGNVEGDIIAEYNSGEITTTVWVNGELYRRASANLNENGLLSKEGSDDDKITFYYDENDQLAGVIYTDRSSGSNTYHSEETKYFWQDGDIVQQKTYVPQSDGKTDVYTTDIVYSTPDIPAIENKGFVLEDESLDYDDIVAYYAGLMGKSTKHLPLAWTETNYNGKVTETGKNTWTLDDKGRAIKVVCEKTYSDGEKRTRTYYWEW